MYRYCPHHKKVVPFQTDYPVDVESSIPPALRANNPDTMIPESPANGGLFGGAQVEAPHGSIPVPPTTTYYIHHNLRSANPPPGAIYQYPGYNRMGNNYTPMPGVYWLNDAERNMDGKYHIKFTKYQEEMKNKNKN